ncbi:ferritin-like domain-containing protein [Actinomadura barringtoniae]|uniref:Ferritin-like domain-containing protein n=1 Tax=Actinomadura barringtoniae TaxID=1427535 RepID=A0A939PHD7_9ACTN|nr:ferritin-like domain-containing protein [Actinomadura barringtoniae]MBO2448576.1 ferritin-like domain-containing protein [Actinomadura barringtoniae]
MREAGSDGPEALAGLAGSWAVPVGGEALFTWDYDQRSERLISLYAKGKQRQWDAETRLDWSHETDPGDPLGMPDELIWIADSELWDRLPEKERSVVRTHTAGWMYSQFLHGEQGALVCAAQVVRMVPDMDAKFYASTQVMDEARHVEAYDRYLREKIGVRYPITDSLQGLLDTIVRDARWDFTYLGMQVLLEGLALASFSIQRDLMTDPLAKAFNAYVLEDESRHVAFGQIALRQYYQDLTEAERREREEFAVEACHVLSERFAGEELWRNLDYGAEECIQLTRKSAALRVFRYRLFSRIVPALKSINLFGPRMQEGLDQLRLLRFSTMDQDEISAADEARAREIEQEELLRRSKQIESTIAAANGDAT